MMNSGDDDFPPNPFRTDGGGAPGFAQPPPQQQQPQFGQPQPQFGGQLDPVQANNHMNQGPQFQPSAAAMGMGGAMSPQQMDPTTPASTSTSWWGLCMACMRLDTYKRYFDVDTYDIQKRMIAAMTHFHQPQYFRDQVVGPENPNLGIDAATTSDLKGPDLYGPVWITFVLILMVAATANWSASLRYSNDVEAEFEYDINHLLHAWTFLTAFVFGVPSVFWLCTRCMSLQALTLPEWICYYGYSMVPYLPASILCTIPVNFIAWIVLMAATAASGLLVLRNASTPLLASDATAQKAPPLILAILVAHFIFFVAMGVTFYHHGKAHHAV
ncbi:Protein YIPF1 [Seminavis robusta]|uniref:Protein YIF1 n=1 Tax=Seminavis robusta TaxID=568900 RepID=A0A9N8DVQ8_9STRA|nr:Protein YIPF1 [Seminavis robusta]|eukprot:Sro379_g130460.1 Protein YIPF1 (328) ;mRNA; f:37936-39060